MQETSRQDDSSLPVQTTAELTVVLVRSEEEEEEGDLKEKGGNKVLMVEKGKSNQPEKEKEEEEGESKEGASCVIHIKCDCNGEIVCRICHLNTEGPMGKMDLIQLGCGCKDELGIAHQHCGEAWFKLKGNRYCEICGEAAKNITGIGDNRFMEEWNERSDGNISNSDTRSGFFRGQPFCNFLMACLVIAFVLPWFFRVNMF